MVAPAGSAWNWSGEHDLWGGDPGCSALRSQLRQAPVDHPNCKAAGMLPPSSALPGAGPHSGSLLDLPHPAPRVVVHKPSPSWFSPVMGFGGPSRVQWEEEQRAQEAARRQQQQLQRPQQQPQQQFVSLVQPLQQTQGPRHSSRPTPAAVPHQQAVCQPPHASPQPSPEHPHAQLPRPPLHQQQMPADPASCSQPLAPLAFEVAKLQQLRLGAQQEQQQRQPEGERSLPWYQQGWHQQDAVQPQPKPGALPQQPTQQQQGRAGASGAAATVYPSGNPFANEPQALPQALPPDDSSGATRPRAAHGSRPAGKLPPPPLFLLARRAQQQAAPQQASAQHVTQHQSSMKPSVQLEGQLQQPSASQPAAAPALHDAVEDVQPRRVSAVEAVGSQSLHGSSSAQEQAAAGWQHVQASAAATSAEQQQHQGLPRPPSQASMPAPGLPPPPPLPPKPAGKGAARPANVPTATSAAAKQPHPASQQPAAAANASRATPLLPPPPPPPPPLKAAAVATGPPLPPPPPLPAACQGTEGPPAGVAALSAIQPAELAAAASRLRSVPASSGGDRAGGCERTAARAVPEGDARAELMAAIRGGQFKLRKAPDRPARPGQRAGWSVSRQGGRAWRSVDWGKEPALVPVPSKAPWASRHGCKPATREQA